MTIEVYILIKDFLSFFPLFLKIIFFKDFVYFDIPIILQLAVILKIGCFSLDSAIWFYSVSAI